MKRAEKIALLTKVLQGGTSQSNRLRLQQVRAMPQSAIIIIDDLDFAGGQQMTDDDPVHFYDKGKKHEMTLGEAHQYARRFGVGTIFILPAKRGA
ncbi:hypothetical protein GO730_26570 [Spirosoma sp. HMF3257]|uniref:Uncharacterized protein n=1 Tax=Spirosoma telluris TaxID=2183553 RepID=A0A327NQ28_9BACT|nr:hypothetical protein [Spirosoma telluris]RAI76835.1 hypothetical protein HMF3257_26500 [Spirosoma telluris]